jgi:hypothetical protein
MIDDRDPRFTKEVRAFAQELNDEFVREYANDPQFRADFNAYLRTLGVPVVHEPPRTLKDMSEYPTTH